MFGKNRGAGTTGPPNLRDICNMLDELRLKYQTFQDKDAVLVPFEGKNSDYECFILVDQERAIVYLAIGGYFSVPVTHPYLSDILRRLMELNWELSIAKMEWGLVGRRGAHVPRHHDGGRNGHDSVGRVHQLPGTVCRQALSCTA